MKLEPCVSVVHRVQGLRSLGLAVSMCVALAACTRPAFTEGVRARFGLSPADIERIQFYTSREIVLQRELGDQARVLASNGLAIHDGVRVEEVDIPARTPGVAIRVEGDYVLVSFSREHPDHALWFGLKKTDDQPSPDAHAFELVQLENPVVESGPFRPQWAKGFLVTYAGQKYRVVDGQAWSAHLLYDLDQSFAKEKFRQEPPGWRLSDSSGAKVLPGNSPAAPPAANALSATGVADAGAAK